MMLFVYFTLSLLFCHTWFNTSVACCFAFLEIVGTFSSRPANVSHCTNAQVSCKLDIMQFLRVIVLPDRSNMILRESTSSLAMLPDVYL